MKMVINVPDGAYVLVRDVKVRHDICDVCQGKGEVILRNKKFLCPQCEGSGSQNVTVTYWGVRGPAEFVRASIDADGEVVCQYKLSSMTVYNKNSSYELAVSAGNLFSTREKAEAEAEKRNNTSHVVRLEGCV